MSMLLKITEYLNCDEGEIVEFIQDNTIGYE